jgi:hypothetical protein
MSCPVLSYLVLSCFALSYPVSFIVLPSLICFILLPYDTVGSLAVAECYGHSVLALVEESGSMVFGILYLAGINPMKGVIIL